MLGRQGVNLAKSSLLWDISSPNLENTALWHHHLCVSRLSEFWCMSRDSNLNELKLRTPFLKCPKEFTLPHIFAILNLIFCPFLNLWINPDSVDYVVSTYVHICTRTASYCTLGRHNLFGFALNLCSHRLKSLIFSPGILITCWLALTVATSRNTMQWPAFSRLCDRFAFNATTQTTKWQSRKSLSHHQD